MTKQHHEVHVPATFVRVELSIVNRKTDTSDVFCPTTRERLHADLDAMLDGARMIEGIATDVLDLVWK
jgi:hypothetical protein